ncbi:uncharacterized protein [Diabrotica undecimpunctata]|uniref:uncharacterized protein n=1 Tax=Diabrotica undecimpunctata TaxID=50387 RepID=UPI003B633733
MKAFVLWTVALVWFCVGQTLGFETGADYYKECADSLGLTQDLYKPFGTNRTQMLCLQKCVFEKDGTLNKKGHLEKSDVLERLFATLFGNDDQKINDFNACVKNLLPRGNVKHCMDVDKIIYCIVSNMHLASPLLDPSYPSAGGIQMGGGFGGLGGLGGLGGFGNIGGFDNSGGFGNLGGFGNPAGFGHPGGFDLSGSGHLGPEHLNSDFLPRSNKLSNGKNGKNA